MRDQKYFKAVLKVVWCEIKAHFQRCLYVEQPRKWPGGGPLLFWSVIKLVVQRCLVFMFVFVFNVVFHVVHYVVNKLNIIWSVIKLVVQRCILRCTYVVQTLYSGMRAQQSDTLHTSQMWRVILSHSAKNAKPRCPSIHFLKQSLKRCAKVS